MRTAKSQSYENIYYMKYCISSTKNYPLLVIFLSKKVNRLILLINSKTLPYCSTSVECQNKHKDISILVDEWMMNIYENHSYEYNRETAA